MTRIEPYYVTQTELQKIRLRYRVKRECEIRRIVLSRAESMGRTHYFAQ